jgi:hypothetical protein
VIPELRDTFNAQYRAEDYRSLLLRLDERTGTNVGFRVAETPVFLPLAVMEEMASAGIRLTRRLLAWPEYMDAARRSIPKGFLVAGQPDHAGSSEHSHPNFLTADFALVESGMAELSPRLVEIQAFPSVYAYQAMLAEEYQQIFRLPDSLGVFLGGVDNLSFWTLFRETVLGKHAAENVVLTEVDPQHQKTLPDFLLTARHLGISIVDIASLVPIGRKLHYRNTAGKLIPVHRIYNRAIADEMIGRRVELPFDLTSPWEVEWAGHPNWYFLISKYSVPWLSEAGETVVPPAAFLDDFLSGEGFDRLKASGIELPGGRGGETVYENLLLKPLFSFAGKGIQFAPTRAELEAIPESDRGNYLLQQRMHFVPTIRTPHGLTQAEIRILYIWPDGGDLTPVLPLVRLGRGKMMGVDHNRNQEWVGASAAFWQ